MFSPVSGAAVGCDFLGTVLVFVDLLRSRKDAERVSAIRDHIIGLEVIQRDTENIPPAPGFRMKETNMDFDKVTEIMREATKDAIAASKKKLLELTDEIEKANRFPLGYLAVAVLALGILLHGVEAWKQDRKTVEGAPVSSAIRSLKAPTLIDISVLVIAGK